LIDYPLSVYFLVYLLYLKPLILECPGDSVYFVRYLGQLARENPQWVVHHGAQTNGEEKAIRDLKIANPILIEKWKPHMDNKIVKTYLTMYTFDPWKWTWEGKERRKKLAEKMNAY